jgi:hypothetical protein
MTKGAKIALGCGCLVLLAGTAIVAVFGVGAFWAKSKVAEVKGGLDKISAKTQQIEALEQKVNANSYTARADGVIPEARFLKFLDTRKRVFAVYEPHKAELSALEAKSKGAGEPSFSDALAAGGKVAEIFGEVRLAQVQALADHGMNEQEYRDIQLAVYKTAWAAESQKQSGKLPAEAIREAGEQMREGMEEGASEARKQGAAGAISEEDQRKLRESMAELGQAAQALEVPKANVELFRKYEADIKKYAMTGLELIGI